MTKKLFGITFLIFLFGGCSNISKEGIKEDGRPVSEMKIYRDSFRTIDVKEIDGSSAFNVEEIFDSVSFIRLSSDTEATIGAIDQIIFLDSVLILRDGYTSKSVKMFSKSGQFVRSIGSHGRGPGEYIEPTFMELYGNKIAIYDQFMRRIQFYNLEGKFLKSVKFPFYSMKFHIFNDNQYLFNSISCDNDEFRSIFNYSVFETDSTGTFTSRGFYRKKNTYQSLVNRHNFFPKNNIVYYRPVYNDTIYSIHENGSIRVEFAVNFGDRTVPEKYRNGKRKRDLRKAQDGTKFLFMNGDFYLTKDYLHFSYSRAHRKFDCIYSLSTGKLISFGKRYGFFPLFFANIIGSTEDAFIGYMFPIMVTNDVAGWKSLPYDSLVKQFGRARTDLGLSMQKEDNPIITFFYPKQF